MTSTIARATSLALGIALGLGVLAGAATAEPTPVGPTGTGPKTTLLGAYLLIDGQGTVREQGYAAAEATLTLPAYWTAVVSGDGSWCVVPDTRAQHNGAADHQADCYSAPEVTQAWARTRATGA